VTKRKTTTGGRDATLSVIPGKFALSVGKPNLAEPAGFTWTRLSDVARIESGHTPSRATAAYWDGPIPWVGIRDATGNHGKTIQRTAQYVTQLGLDNSSARLLPAGTVCLSRTASVGYVVTMGVPMATSQDFVNWICGPELSSTYLMYILMAEQESVRRFSHGTTHQTMYYPEAKALNVLIPSRREQDAIVDVLGALDEKIAANSNLAITSEELAITLLSGLESTLPLSAVVRHHKKSTNPALIKSALVAHFSLPAFDVDRLPDVTNPEEIKSSKSAIEQPSVLISKLNPRFPRVWDISEVPSIPALSSTEFLVLEPLFSSSTFLWAMLLQPSFGTALESKVAGTSGSHQRVKPADLLDTAVLDPRNVPANVRDQVTSIGSRGSQARAENFMLAATRDALLPQLMSGTLRVKDAAKVLEGAGV
jgi:type I restriction enzyme S subunit